jgi:acetyl esterase/lipase
MRRPRASAHLAVLAGTLSLLFLSLAPGVSAESPSLQPLPGGGLPPLPSGGLPPLPSGPAPTYSKIPYATASSAESLDIWMPKDTEGPIPLVILVHPGGFMFGDAMMMADVAGSVVDAGYAAASVDYRLSGEATFPAAVQDVKAAVRWLRANADTYGFDARRFAAWGESAGANLAALIGVTGDQATLFDDAALGNPDVSSAVLAVVAWYPPVDFLTLDSMFAAHTPTPCVGKTQDHNAADSPESRYLGAPIQTVPDKAKAADPVTYIAGAKTLPVFSIAAGSDDCTIPYEQSMELDAALKAGGADSTFTLVPGADHGDPKITTDQTPVALKVLASVFGG